MRTTVGGIAAARLGVFLRWNGVGGGVICWNSFLDDEVMDPVGGGGEMKIAANESEKRST